MSFCRNGNTAMDGRIEIGSVESLPEGRLHAVRAGERDLVVVRKGDEFFAIRDACPHQGAKLSSGELTGDVQPCLRGDQPVLYREGEFVSCPWHGWKIDVRSGQSPTEPEAIRVKTYDVSVDGGRVFVEIGR